LPQAQVIRATNAQGDVIYGPGVRSPPSNVADRDYFLALRDNPKLGLLVVNPLLGQIDQQWVWPFVRRINRPDGAFAGVVYVRINTTDVDAMLAQFKLDASGILALRDKDFGLIARHQWGGKNQISTGDKKLSDTFVEAFKANPLEGSYSVSADNSLDGISRTYAYRRNPQYQFLVSDAIDSIYRVTPQEVREDASPVFTRLHPDDYASVVASIQTSARDLTPWQHEYRVKFDDGTVRWLLGHAMPQPARNGAVLWHGFITDITDRLLHCVREVDTVARFGGDEFVVLLSDLDADRSASCAQAQAIAENICNSLAQPYRLILQSHQSLEAIEVVHRCTASIGVMLFGNHEASQDDLLKWADAAMYQAKEAGRNCIFFHDMQPQEVTL
jgi:diguanylate cyclase (GGDEF)-like protein